jgi:hypothetical protein
MLLSVPIDLEGASREKRLQQLQRVGSSSLIPQVKQWRAGQHVVAVEAAVPWADVQVPSAIHAASLDAEVAVRCRRVSSRDRTTGVSVKVDREPDVQVVAIVAGGICGGRGRKGGAGDQGGGSGEGIASGEDGAIVLLSFVR